ncbi:MAG: GYD domain-containing protein [Sedimentisphaerales bacterium]|nr:GYD domain-containing protein [Sedimentisphaerales bacterium]
MATYVSLVNFTEKGAGDIKATTERAEKFKAAAQRAGVTVKEVLWTMGAYDIVLILEGPDDKTMAAVLVNLASLGNVKTQTMRGFNAAEMKEITSKTAK